MVKGITTEQMQQFHMAMHGAPQCFPGCCLCKLDRYVAVLQAALCGVPLPYENEIPGITEALKYKPRHQAIIIR